MSSTQSASPQRAVLTTYTGSYWNALAVSHLIYDWLISLNDEIALIWTPRDRRMCATIVYVLSRYFTILQYTVPTIPFGTIPFLMVVTLVPNAAVAVFSGLRVYALSGANIKLSALVVALAIGPRILDSIVNGLGVHADNWATPAACMIARDNAAELNFMCKSVPLWAASLVCCVDYVCTDTVIARTCSIAADVLVVGVTWLNAYNTARLSNVDIGPTLGRVMLYDGSVYFIVLATINIARIVTSALALPVPISNDQMASIIVSHFILNLRSVNQNAATASTVSFVQFQRPSDGRLPEYVASFSGPMHIGHSGVNDGDDGADITEVPTDCPPLSDVETGIGSVPEEPAR
ncbi:hypothetical protein C8Q76DRAFT_791056 [Earliella scabrosa]|nr:hypothetical protein C8Q76DRAFT_791056 [Earliella scabrosa]